MAHDWSMPRCLLQETLSKNFKGSLVYLVQVRINHPTLAITGGLGMPTLRSSTILLPRGPAMTLQASPAHGRGLGNDPLLMTVASTTEHPKNKLRQYDQLRPSPLAAESLNLHHRHQAPGPEIPSTFRNRGPGSQTTFQQLLKGWRVCRDLAGSSAGLLRSCGRYLGHAIPKWVDKIVLHTVHCVNRLVPIKSCGISPPQSA